MADTLTSRILSYVAVHYGCCATEVSAALGAKKASVAAILAQKRRIGILEHISKGASHRQSRYCKPAHPRPRVPKVRKNAKPVESPARQPLMSQDRGKIEKWTRTTKSGSGHFPEKYARELHPLNRPDIFAHMRLAMLTRGKGAG